MIQHSSPARSALRAAFPLTIPVLTGYAFLGMTYGVYMRVSGFPWWFPLLTSVVVFGGSLEFLLVSLLQQPFSPLQIFITALMLQARHLFYGIAMLDNYKGTDWKKPYLIFGLTDETFSIACTAEIPADVDRGWFYFFVTLLDHFYWIAASTFGGLLGALLPINTQGLDFVMTAMFVVIFLEEFQKEPRHYSSLLGLAAAIACRFGFGADNFLIPTMVCVLLSLTLLRRPIERKGNAL